MQDKYDLYEYAIIRVVPCVGRGEFLNVGVVMFCKKKRWLKMEYHIREELFKVFCPTLDLEFIKKNLNAFQQIARGENKDSPIAQMEVDERFRWLAAVRSSVIQTSPTHVGLSEDLNSTFQQIIKEQVH